MHITYTQTDTHLDIVQALHLFSIDTWYSVHVHANKTIRSCIHYSVSIKLNTHPPPAVSCIVHLHLCISSTCTWYTDSTILYTVYGIIRQIDASNQYSHDPHLCLWTTIGQVMPDPRIYDYLCSCCLSTLAAHWHPHTHIHNVSIHMLITHSGTHASSFSNMSEHD